MPDEDWKDIALPGMELLTPEQFDAPSNSGVERPSVRNDPYLEVCAADHARFNEKVIKTPGCWLWVGAISSPDGYGRFTWQRGNKQRTMLAHRFALLVAGASLSEGVVAEHACNEPLCVRVDSRHVHESSQAANLAFAVSLGRLRGPRPGSSDGVHRVERSRRVREAVIGGWDPVKYQRSIGVRDDDHPQLF